MNEESKPILDKILSEEESRKMEALKPSKIINNVLNRLRDREREVLVARYGLSSDKLGRMTLESIGKELSVTRERIRQVEKAVLKKISKKYSSTIKPLWNVINEYLSIHGGVLNLQHLINQFTFDKKEEALESNALKLAVASHPRLIQLKRHPLFREGWVDEKVDLNKINEINKVAVQLLKSRNNAIAESELIKRIIDKVENVAETLIKGALRISSELGIDNNGNWGLSSWSTVVPRRIRDKAHIIMEEVNKPLHFKDITNLIQEKFSSNKPILSRTVHNELISDSRFVLVGRGVYALKKWGYKPGVVADVIREVLSKTKQPMHVSDIVREVMKRRQVKRNTIVANLQNQSLFRKIAKATYTLANGKDS